MTADALLAVLLILIIIDSAIWRKRLADLELRITVLERKIIEPDDHEAWRESLDMTEDDFP